MAKEAFSAIFAAEKTAAELLKDARREAQERLDKADEISLAAVREVLVKADREVERLEQAAREEGEKRSRPILDAAEHEARALLDLSAEELEPAVSYVIEKVTKYGDR